MLSDTMTKISSDSVPQIALTDTGPSLLGPGPRPRRSGAIRRKTWTGAPAEINTQLRPHPVELDSAPIHRSSETSPRLTSLMVDVLLSPDMEGFKEVCASPMDVQNPDNDGTEEPSRSGDHLFLPAPLSWQRQKAHSQSAPSPLRHTVATTSPQDSSVQHPTYAEGVPDVALQLRKRLEEIMTEWQADIVDDGEVLERNRLTSDSWMVF